MVIFLSNFLALLIKGDAAGESNRDMLGGLVVAVNIVLILAVLFTTWFSTQQQVDDSRDNENIFTTAKTMAKIADRRVTPDSSGLPPRPTRAHDHDEEHEHPPTSSVHPTLKRPVTSAAVEPGGKRPRRKDNGAETGVATRDVGVVGGAEGGGGDGLGGGDGGGGGRGNVSLVGEKRQYRG